METCYPTTPTACDPSVETCPGGMPANSINPPWQFTHTFSTGTSNSFSTQFQISQVSQDENWMFWSTDGDCGLGSESGSPPAVWSSGTYYQMLLATPVPASMTSLCGLPWVSSAAYTAGNTINPIEGTSGTGAIDDVFQALTSSTTGPASSLNSGQPSCQAYVSGTLTAASCFAVTNPPSSSPSTVTSASETGTTGTFTVSTAVALNGGVKVTISGFAGASAGWNGTWPVNGAVGANCPGSACASVSTFQLAGLPTGLSTPSSYSGVTASVQGDTVCDLTVPGQDSINASSCAGVTWADLGPQNQRGDVFAVNLGSHK